jgi:RNA polymerase sigma factor for flagellar operon FliA
VDPAARAQLVEAHLDVARKAAAMIFPRVKEHVEFDDLFAFGAAGLAEAAQRYDERKGASFATFAWYRVQGAIVDGLRKQTNLPRRVWRTLVALRAANAYLENRAERDRGAAERGVAAPQGADALDSVKSALSAIRTMYMTSFEVLVADGYDQALPVETSPEERLHSQRMAKKLRDALESLPEREAAMIKKHYWEGKNLVEAGEEMGISKSWASRLHAQAVEKLRTIVDAES